MPVRLVMFCKSGVNNRGLFGRQAKSFYYFRDSILPSFSITRLLLSRYLRAITMILVYFTVFTSVIIIIIIIIIIITII